MHRFFSGAPQESEGLNILETSPRGGWPVTPRRRRDGRMLLDETGRGKGGRTETSPAKKVQGVSGSNRPARGVRFAPGDTGVRSGIRALRGLGRALRPGALAHGAGATGKWRVRAGSPSRTLRNCVRVRAVRGGPREPEVSSYSRFSDGLPRIPAGPWAGQGRSRHPHRRLDFG
jgi:hypothetical protein